MVETERFFKAIWPDLGPEDCMECRYSHDPDMAKVRRIWGRGGHLTDWLVEVGKVGRSLPHSIHYSVALRNQESGKKSAVERISCLWVDIDEVPSKKTLLAQLQCVGLSPGIIVNSGWGLHLFYPLKRSVSRDEGERLNRMLAVLTGGDSQASDSAHTLRFPLSYNCKTVPPVRTAFQILESGVYDVEERIRQIEPLLADRLGPCARSEERPGRVIDNQAYADSGQLTPPPLSFFERADCPLIRKMFLAPQDVTFKEWFSVGCACRILFGETKGLEVWHALSRPDGSRYVPSDLNARWNEMERLMPSGCAKLDMSDCHHLSEGKCRNLLTAIRRICLSFKRNEISRGSAGE